MNGHCEDHWTNTKAAEFEKTGDGSSAGHCIAMSLNDLSIWCYECQAYLINDDLTKLTRKFESAKFGHDEICVEDDQSNKAPEKYEHQSSSKRHKSEEQENREDFVKCNKKCDGITLKCEPDARHINEPEDVQTDSNDSNIGTEDDEDEASQPGVGNDCNDDDYVHPHLPNSMSDLAAYIKSEKCKSIVILAGAGMSRASGSKFTVFLFCCEIGETSSLTSIFIKHIIKYLTSALLVVCMKQLSLNVLPQQNHNEIKLEKIQRWYLTNIFSWKINCLV